MITINGSQGEGGGQILRTSLALSLVTGRPFRIEKIRAGRAKPGLLRQHLTAAHAAAEVGDAEIQGDVLGSSQLTFQPRRIQSGSFPFAVGTAGSATLVLQTILPALILASGPSELKLEGGTHNPYAPPFDFLAKAFIPLLERMGPAVETRLDRYGFYPAGGGCFTASIRPVSALAPLELMERGNMNRRFARAIHALLPGHVSERELRVVKEKLSLKDEQLRSEAVQNSSGPGNVLMVELEAENLTEVFTGFGEKGVASEAVASHVVDDVRRYLAAGVPVGRYLADQLLIPMALAGEGRLETLAPSRHTMTNIAVISEFLGLRIKTKEHSRDKWEIAVERS